MAKRAGDGPAVGFVANHVRTGTFGPDRCFICLDPDRRLLGDATRYGGRLRRAFFFATHAGNSEFLARHIGDGVPIGMVAVGPGA